MSEASIFAAALEKPPGSERAAFVDEACGEDARLRRRVDALLRAHEEPDDVLEPIVQQTAAYEPIAEKPGAKVGPYLLREQIGEGGFGLVFVAEQQEPVKRKVALKVIKPGMDSNQVIARFEAERQALALMDHPNIARVLDAGTTGSGRPYFVMELVRGIPITDYCDQHQLATRDRLDLFVSVCHAIQHAHQKGVIHRDVKPSNVLVTSHDGKPVAKVIDFGVAKAIHQQLTERTIYTNFAQMIGTPLYMSPEQAEMSGLDIDTRSDVYSLGVLLYELLTGSTPLEKQRLAKAAFDEIRRLIREEEPPKPSTRLSSTESIASIAAQRHSEPAKLSKLVRGDLDWITMKALEKDRTRRYETANGLARDLQRYLSDEPVEACPPSAGYRLRKFAKKNRAAISTAASFAVMLILGAGVATWQAIRASQAERVALNAQRAEADRAEGERIAREREAERADGERRAKQEALAAKARAEKAEEETLASYRASTDDAIEQLIGSKPRLGPSERKYLESTAKRWQAFAARKGDDKRARAVRGEGCMRVGLLWAKLGRRDEAYRELEQALAIAEKLTDDYPDEPGYRQALAQCRNNLGTLLRGRGKRSEAELQFRQALSLQAQLAAKFPALADYRRVLAGMHMSLGALLSDQRKLPEAAEQYRQSLALTEKLADEFPRVTAYRKEMARCRNSLGNALRDQGKLQEAEEQYRRALAIGSELVAAHADEPAYRQELAASRQRIGDLLLFDLGKLPEAESEYRLALAIREKLAADLPSSPEHQRELGNCYCNFGILVAKSGRPGEGLDWFEKAMKVLGPLYEQDQRSVGAKRFLMSSHLNRAYAHNDLRNYAEALKDWDRAVELCTEDELPFARAGRALSRLHVGRIAEAVADVVDLTKPMATGSPDWSANEWYNFACIYAVASDKIAGRKREYADAAVGMLSKAVKAGFKDAAQMKKDDDLAALGDREDFKKLLTELERSPAKTK